MARRGCRGPGFQWKVPSLADGIADFGLGFMTAVLLWGRR